MSVEIHPSSIIAPGAVIGEGCKIGPFCTIGSEAKLERGVILESHVSIKGPTYLGEECLIGSFVTLGSFPAIQKANVKRGVLRIGSHTRIFDQSTVGSGYMHETTIGDHAFLMYATHIAHDCSIGNHVTIASLTCLGGHCHIEDYATLSGQIAVHQFVNIGRLAFVSGSLAVSFDILPYAICGGERLAHVSTLNVVGMRRQGIEKARIRELNHHLWRIYDRQQGTINRLELNQLRRETHPEKALVHDVLAFIDDPKRKRPLAPCLIKEHTQAEI